MYVRLLTLVSFLYVLISLPDLKISMDVDSKKGSGPSYAMKPPRMPDHLRIFVDGKLEYEKTTVYVSAEHVWIDAEQEALKL